jgi:antitoxin (DNA-binding transcriptional repressor) of toxin-antitoxin stability system
MQVRDRAGGWLDLWPSDGYIRAMSKHGLVEIKNKLSELIDRPRDGEEIIIIWHGQPVAAINRIPPRPNVLRRPASTGWNGLGSGTRYRKKTTARSSRARETRNRIGECLP